MKILKSILIVTVILFVSITTQAQEIFDAVKNNDLAKVKVLIEKEPSLLGKKDDASNTPLHQAAISGTFEITEYLLFKGADINSENSKSNSPLHESLINGKNEIAKILIEKGADVQKQNLEGKTPLHYAARYSRIPILELLISKGVNLEVQDKNRKHTPLLYLSMMANNADAAKILIEKGANVNVKDRDSWTPLNHAIHGRNIELINLLLDQNADIDTSLDSRKLMFDMSAGLGLPRLFKYIQEKSGASLFNEEADKNNYMRSALNGGSIEIVQILQEKNIPINLEADINGWTPLHYSARGNKPEMIEYLVRKGADINKRTNAGKSVYNVADENGHKGILNTIIKLGGNSEPQKFPVLQGTYLGQVPPGKELKRFAPGIVSAWHSSISTSPDGKELYWGSGVDFMVSRIEKGKWTKPEVVSFSGKGTTELYDDVPFVTPDNKRLYFTSQRPLDSGSNKENIWYVERTDSGWGEPKPVTPEVNAFTLHWQVSVSNSGTLYFSGGSSSTGRGIFYSRIVNGEHIKPEKVNLPDEGGGTCPFISPDETYLTFARVVEGRPIPYISFKSENGEWMEPINLEKYLGNSNCMVVTPDRKYLFTQGGLWVDASFIEALRPKK